MLINQVFVYIFIIFKSTRLKSTLSWDKSKSILSLNEKRRKGKEKQLELTVYKICRNKDR